MNQTYTEENLVQSQRIRELEEEVSNFQQRIKQLERVIYFLRKRAETAHLENIQLQSRQLNDPIVNLEMDDFSNKSIEEKYRQIQALLIPLSKLIESTLNDK